MNRDVRDDANDAGRKAQRIDVPQKRRFCFGLRTLLAFVGVLGVSFAVLARPTDPMLAANEMTKVELWWRCGWPDYTESSGWGYVGRGQEDSPSSVFVAIKNGRVKVVYHNP